MFEGLEMLPPDPILQLMQQFREDPREEKVDLGIGVYRDEAGNTPVMAAVREAEQQLLARETTKTYLGPAGSAGFNEAVADLVLGCDSSPRRDGRVSVVQTPGGCGALRMAAELLKLCRPETRVWVSDPTWGNHLPLLGGAGLSICEYPYLDPVAGAVNFAAMLESLDKARPGDVVLLHGCCHNPSGADLTLAQWRQLADMILRRRLLPFVDLAYQGLGAGPEADVAGLRHLADAVPEMVVAVSCSKNFGLYRERTGALILMASSPADREIAVSQLLNVIRSNYSMPPAHGAAIVETILTDQGLRRLWQEELADMCRRIRDLRRSLAEALAPVGDFSFIACQRGMFSLLGIRAEQIRQLRGDHGIYILESGRINVAGLNSKTLPVLAEAVRAVL